MEVKSKIEAEQSIMGKNVKLIILHSSIHEKEHHHLFELDHVKRKIILSTNIAESSITIPDCIYVIDFCLTKQLNYNPKNMMEKLEIVWASKASLDQRTGRVGRVAPGFSFRLIPEEFYRGFQ